MSIDVQARSDIEQLVQQVFFCLDARDYPGAAATFAEDGTWVRGGQPYTGHAAIIAALEKRPTTMIIMHLLSNLRFAPEGANECAVSGYLTAYRYDSGRLHTGPAPLGPPVQVGPFRVRANRGAQGGWRLSYLDTEGPTFLASVKA